MKKMGGRNRLKSGFDFGVHREESAEDQVLGKNISDTFLFDLNRK